MVVQTDNARVLSGPGHNLTPRSEGTAPVREEHTGVVYRFHPRNFYQIRLFCFGFFKIVKKVVSIVLRGHGLS